MRTLFLVFSFSFFFFNFAFGQTFEVLKKLPKQEGDFFIIKEMVISNFDNPQNDLWVKIKTNSPKKIIGLLEADVLRSETDYGLFLISRENQTLHFYLESNEGNNWNYCDTIKYSIEFKISETNSWVYKDEYVWEEKPNSLVFLGKPKLSDLQTPTYTQNGRYDYDIYFPIKNTGDPIVDASINWNKSESLEILKEEISLFRKNFEAGFQKDLWDAPDRISCNLNHFLLIDFPSFSKKTIKSLPKDIRKKNKKEIEKILELQNQVFRGGGTLVVKKENYKGELELIEYKF